MTINATMKFIRYSCDFHFQSTETTEITENSHFQFNTSSITNSFSPHHPDDPDVTKSEPATYLLAIGVEFDSNAILEQVLNHLVIKVVYEVGGEESPPPNNYYTRNNDVVIINIGCDIQLSSRSVFSLLYLEGILAAVVLAIKKKKN